MIPFCKSESKMYGGYSVLVPRRFFTSGPPCLCCKGSVRGITKKLVGCLGYVLDMEFEDTFEIMEWKVLGCKKCTVSSKINK